MPTSLLSILRKLSGTKDRRTKFKKNQLFNLIFVVLYLSFIAYYGQDLLLLYVHAHSVLTVL
jgi:hypothetical protein